MTIDAVGGAAVIRARVTESAGRLLGDMLRRRLRESGGKVNGAIGLAFRRKRIASSTASTPSAGAKH